MVKLPDTDRGFFPLLLRILPGLFDGWGAPNFANVNQVFDLYSVSAGERPILMDRVLLVVKAINEIRERDRKK